MHLKNILIYLLFLLIPAINHAQDKDSILQWQKTYGGSRGDYAQCAINTSDGGYILAGGTYSFDGDVNYTGNDTGNLKYCDIWIIKINKNGLIEWNKTYGGSGFDYIASIIPSIDSGYVVVGSTTSANGNIGYNHGGEDIWVFEIDKFGNLNWEKTYGGTGDENVIGSCIVSTNDSCYIVSGSSDSYDKGVLTTHSGSEDVYCFKINKKGDLLWQKTYGGLRWDQGQCIIKSPKSGYLLGAYTESGDGDVIHPHGYAWVINIDDQGKIIWQKTYGDSLNVQFNSLTATPDTGFIACGSISPYFKNGKDVWVVKFKNDSLIQWSDTLGGSRNDIGVSSVITTDSNIIVAGITSSIDGNITRSFNMDSSKYDIWIIKLDAEGKMKWQKSFGSSYDDFAYSITSCKSGGFLVSGITTSDDHDVTFNHGEGDAWLIKLKGSDTTTVGVSSQNTAPSFINIYPNPTNSNLYFQVKDNTLSHVSAQAIITDLSGRTLLIQQIIESESTMDVSTLPSGIYLLRYQDADRVWNGKFVKE